MCRLLAVLIALAISCPSHAADLVVSAAASLSNAFRDIAPAFEARHPGARVQLNFGASGALMQQIAQGAPADVYASADQHTMDQAQAQGLLQNGARRNFVSNALVVIVPAASRTSPGTLNALLEPSYKRIAIGVPSSVPVGRYTRGVLEKAGIWAPIEARMIGAHSVRQALDYVARAEVDAGFVYATDAAIMPDKVRLALVVPTDTPILYPIAPVAASANSALARQFVDFVASAPAQAVFAKYGFGKP
ncbi:MAG: molybdate ABC transporter substrate-binding protein [Noviherbaspirillum sp.]